MDDHIYIVDSQTGFTRNDIRNCRKKLIDEQNERGSCLQLPLYIILDEEIIPRHLAADDIRDLIQVVD